MPLKLEFLRILRMYQYKFGYFKLYLLSIKIDSCDNMALLKICKLKTFHGERKRCINFC